MNEAEFQELIEASWRRRLTPDEEAQLQTWLVVHPERQLEWEAESGLNRALDRLPDAPVPSNFTALVLQAARRATARPEKRPLSQRLVALLFPRPATGLAWAALLVCVSWFAWHQVQMQSHHQQARDLAILSSAAVLPETLSLEDFEAIRRLPQAEDEELFAVLNQAAPAE